MSFPEPLNMTLLENRAVVMQAVKMRPHWNGVGSCSNMTAVFVRRENRDTDAQGEYRMRMEAETE